jgi:hypothetical protein
VITAAHCVTSQSTRGIVFVPAYHAGHEPDGVWHVTRVFVNRAWRVSKDQDDDFAFLVIGRSSSGRAVQNRTGGEKLGIFKEAHELVDVVGYPDKARSPIHCENWALIAVLGGYEEGGAHPRSRTRRDSSRAPRPCMRRRLRPELSLPFFGLGMGGMGMSRTTRFP